MGLTGIAEHLKAESLLWLVTEEEVKGIPSKMGDLTCLCWFEGEGIHM